MILNKNNFVELRNGKVTQKTFSHLFPLLDKLPGQYWYIELADIHCFTDELIEIAIPTHIQNTIKTGSLKLIIVNYLEGFHIVVDYIYKRLIIDKGLPTNKIYFFSESYNITDAIKIASQSYSLPEIKTYYLRFFENSVARQELSHKNILQKNIKKKFINLNRRWRPHRPTLVGLLHARNLLQHGYVSLPKSLEGHDYKQSFDFLCYLNRQNENVSELLADYKPEITNLPELVVDRNDFDNNEPLANHLPNLAKFYNETMFSVVSETNFYKEFHRETSIFFTEKTYKAIAHKHPFILVSMDKSLRALRTLGYKTFSPFIKEDYDEIDNDAYRMSVILHEIERLCNMDEKQTNEFIIGCQEICEHNYKLLMSRTKLDNCLLPLN